MSAPPFGPSMFKQIALLIPLALLLGLYLGGYGFLWSVHRPVTEATPLTLLRYAYYYHDLPDIHRKVIVSATLGEGVALLLALILSLPRPRPLHGEARPATRQEIRQAGLLGAEGIILGKVRGFWGDRYLTLGGQQGVLVAAPPRSGKGVGIVIPNLLNWPDSVVCIDIKGENFKLTAEFRRQHDQQVFLFNPTARDGRTARWNPLHYVSDDPRRRIDDLQQIATMLYPEGSGTQAFWDLSARTFFIGIALYVCETASRPRTLGEILRQGMAADTESVEAHWKRIIEGRQRGPHPLSMPCVRAIYDSIQGGSQTALGIRKTFTSRLDLWLNPLLDAATSGNDFDLRDLRKQRISIYVAVTPDDVARMRPVLNLFFQQAIGQQTHELPEHNAQLKFQLLMMLDEFTALGVLPIFTKALAFIPGYNVRTVMVIQSPSQLKETFGVFAAETMMKSLAARVVFAPKDFHDAREIADELGTYTVKVRSRSWSMWGGKGGSTSESTQRRALLLPQELKALGKDQSIIFYEGVPPILARKIRYFKERAFKRRVLPAPTVAPLDIGAHEAMVTAAEATMGPAGPAPARDRPKRARRMTPKDLARLGTLALADIDADFSRITLPKNQPATRAELQQACDELLTELAA